MTQSDPVTPAEQRSGAQRKADTLAQLRARERDAWVASATVSADGSPRAPGSVIAGVDRRAGRRRSRVGFANGA